MWRFFLAVGICPKLKADEKTGHPVEQVEATPDPAGKQALLFAKGLNLHVPRDLEGHGNPFKEPAFGPWAHQQDMVSLHDRFSIELRHEDPAARLVIAVDVLSIIASVDKHLPMRLGARRAGEILLVCEMRKPTGEIKPFIRKIDDHRNCRGQVVRWVVHCERVFEIAEVEQHIRTSVWEAAVHNVAECGYQPPLGRLPSVSEGRSPKWIRYSAAKLPSRVNPKINAASRTLCISPFFKALRTACIRRIR